MAIVGGFVIASISVQQNTLDWDSSTWNRDFLKQHAFLDKKGGVLHDSGFCLPPHVSREKCGSIIMALNENSALIETNLGFWAILVESFRKIVLLCLFSSHMVYILG